MSHLEELLASHIQAAGLPTPVRELPFAKPRRFRFDFAWPDQMLALEIDGATWANGRHNRGSGVASDCEKASFAAILGWRLLRVNGNQVLDGRALEWARRALGSEENTHVA